MGCAEEAGKPLQGLVTADLHLYKERHGSIKKERARRNPDAAIFRDVESSLPKFDAVARRDTWMVVVAKRCMNKKGQADALVGLERDFVNAAVQPSAEMRVSTSVFTDGVHWYFVRIAWRFKDARWQRRFQMSEKIDVTVDGGWAKLAQWFAFAMYEAVFKPTEPTSIDTHVWTVGDDSWQLADVMSSGTRSVVTRWRKPIVQTGSAAVYETVIVKFIRGGDAALDRVNRGYFDRELAMLQERDIARSQHFAHIASFPRLDDV